MYKIGVVLIVFLTSIVDGAAALNTTTRGSANQKIELPVQFEPKPQNSPAQSQLEQAAIEFDSFAIQLPNVIKVKLESFMKYGFRSILMKDSETKPAEEKLIQSLSNGLRLIGGAFQEDTNTIQIHQHDVGVSRSNPDNGNVGSSPHLTIKSNH